MKRLLLILALVLAPAALFAQVADSDVLLAPDGTLYTIESKAAIEGDSNRSLQLTITQGNKSTVTTIPESLTGTNWRPALTYESDSKAVFVFWIGQVNGMSSKLLFASYLDGKWSPAVSIDDQPYTYRYNLRIAITRHVSTLQPDGSWADAPALLVHAVWWEDAGGNREKARYALFTIENSRVTNYEIHDLLSLAQIPDMAYAVDEKFNSEILRHPAILEGTNSVDVIFGDIDRMSMNRITLKPIADGRVHVPVGSRGGHPFQPPHAFSAAWTGRISTIGSGPDLIMYNTTREATSYVMYSNGKWSDVRMLQLSENFSADAAAVALYRMLTAQQ
ncbi:MAG TPA: hypothetical protein VEO74_11820 [Thermoanaerobaculia bacterium]|nr:hypothetical protein [Thermoanaerobaculia bacterium]